MEHLHHERLVEEVRSWYLTAHPKTGYQVERRRFGYYTRNPNRLGFGRCYVVIDELTIEEMPAFLQTVRAYFGAGQIEICANDRETDTRLRAALVAAGCVRMPATAYLAQVGPLPLFPAEPGVAVVEADTATLAEYAIAKLKGFANREDDLAREAIEREVAARRGDHLQGAGRFLLARVGGETAAILGYYDGDDRLVFQLATRVPFRSRGIARQLLGGVLSEARDKGCRSVIINTDPDDWPVGWYRRLGFTDEVYWHRNYLYAPP